MEYTRRFKWSQHVTSWTWKCWGHLQPSTSDGVTRCWPVYINIAPIKLDCFYIVLLMKVVKCITIPILNMMFSSNEYLMSRWPRLSINFRSYPYIWYHMYLLLNLSWFEWLVTTIVQYHSKRLVKVSRSLQLWFECSFIVDAKPT